MIKSLVIGGSGFLGSHLIDLLSKKNHIVTNFDIKKSKWNNKSVKFVKGNILNEKLISQVIKDKDYVFLFAGLSDLDEALVKPLKAIKMNILATSLVSKYCVIHNVKRLIFASSIYANSEEGGFYSSSKRAAEDFILQFSKKQKLKFTILRYGSLYGPRSNYKNGLYRILINALKKRKLEYYGFPHNKRKYIDVETASKLTFISLKKKFENKYLNLVGKENIKILKLFQEIEKILSLRMKKKFYRKKIIGHYVVKPTRFRVKIGNNLFLKKEDTFFKKLKKFIMYLNDKNKIFKRL